MSYTNVLRYGMKNECRPNHVTLSNGSISYLFSAFIFSPLGSRVNKNNEQGTKKGFLKRPAQKKTCVH